MNFFFFTFLNSGTVILFSAFPLQSLLHFGVSVPGFISKASEDWSLGILRVFLVEIFSWKKFIMNSWVDSGAAEVSDTKANDIP